MPEEDEHTEPQMSLIDRSVCVLGWRIWGKRRRRFSACGCGENYLITASVPRDSFHLDQFNNLTDTNFFAVSVAQPIWEWRIQQSLVVSLDSSAQGWGWNIGGEKVTGWSFSAPGWACSLNNMKYLVLICKLSKQRMRPVGGVALRPRNAMAVRGFHTQRQCFSLSFINLFKWSKMIFFLLLNDSLGSWLLLWWGLELEEILLPLHILSWESTCVPGLSMDPARSSSRADPATWVSVGAAEWSQSSLQAQHLAVWFLLFECNHRCWMTASEECKEMVLALAWAG